VVVAAFDDHRPVAAVPVPTAMPAAVVVTELGACAAKFPMSTELAPIAEMVAADANANAAVLSGSYGRCRNGIVAIAASARLSFLMFHPLIIAQEKTMKPKACS
jgi:hypothetical protein